MSIFDHHVTHSTEPTYDCNVCEILFRPMRKLGECFRFFTIATKVCLDCGKPLGGWHEQEHPHINARGQCLGFRSNGLQTSRSILRQTITDRELEEVAEQLRLLAGDLMEARTAARTAANISRETVAAWVHTLDRLSQGLARSPSSTLR